VPDTEITRDTVDGNGVCETVTLVPVFFMRPLTVAPWCPMMALPTIVGTSTLSPKRDGT
jgi:hypothetical protein